MTTATPTQVSCESDMTKYDASSVPQPVRPRTPRELLRKVPRRVSVLGQSSSSLEPAPLKVPRRPTPSPTEMITITTATATGAAATATTTTTTMATTATASCSLERPEPVLMKAKVPLGIKSPRLHKPTPTRAAAADSNNSPAITTDATTASTFASSVFKPTDPTQELMARKQLMLQSRRKSHQQEHQHHSTAAIAKARARGVPKATASVPKVAPVIHRRDTTVESPAEKQQPSTPSPIINRILPIGGWVDGQFIFTGIVKRRDATRTVRFCKMDDPNNMVFDQNFHPMSDAEIWSELAHYDHLNYHCGLGIIPVQVMNLKTGRPLLAALQDPLSPTPLPPNLFMCPIQGGAESKMGQEQLFQPCYHPGQPTRYQHDHQQQQQATDNFCPYAHQAHFPAVAAASEAFNLHRPEELSFGLAEIKGKEACFYTDPDLQTCDIAFPYNQVQEGQNGRRMITASAQHIRAGDHIKVVVCGGRRVSHEAYPTVEQIQVVHEPLWMKVLSVTSFGQITAIAFKASVWCKTIHPKSAVSFPSTCVAGVRFGHNWPTAQRQRDSASSGGCQG